METGFFTMDDVHAILACKSLTEAKTKALIRVDRFAIDHPKVKNENLAKVRAMVGKATTINKLALGMSNFVLAHPSEGLKAI